ncbi:MAG TPA: tripartite tricarboxylate transporter substrate binding protein [Burkholderiales bacterium]|nr:tripartite tricarboxylate transporter substrate binding protein [Burkholderiales bacterium]
MKTRAALAALAIALSAQGAFGQNYPSKPIRIVVPFPAGGGVDATARALGQKLTEMHGQPVIIDNRGGAGGTIGTDVVAKAPPDGYTLLVTSFASISVAPLLYPQLPYVPTRDLAPVSMLVTMPFILVTHPSLPVKTAKDLIALAKASPGKLMMASGGPGTGQHLAGELFNMLAGTKMLHVPYKGTAPAVTDTVGGHAHLTFSDPSVVPQILAGKLKAIGVSGSRRYEALPDVPLITETGVSGYTAVNWYPMMAPAKTPNDILAALNASVQKIFKDPAVAKTLSTQGLLPAADSREALANYIRQDIKRWDPVIKATGLRLN